MESFSYRDLRGPDQSTGKINNYVIGEEKERVGDSLRLKNVIKLDGPSGCYETHVSVC